MKSVDDGPGRRRRIEWADLHARLRQADERLRELDAPGRDTTRRVLEERARQLARQPAATVAPMQEIEVVEFLLAHECYAVESRFVREVGPLQGLTPLPGLPAHVRGIAHLRGRMLAVIDLKRFFELPATGLTNLDRIVVVQSEAMEFGILADGLVGTRSLALAELQPALPTLTGIRNEYLLGLAPGRLIVLDAARLLADRRIVVDDPTHHQSQRG